MIKRMDHVAIAVKSIDEALKFYSDVLGLKPKKIEIIADQGVKAALIPVGDGEIELLEPIDPQAGVAKFIERQGEGLHHICLEVDQVDDALKEMEGKGVQLVDKKGRPGLAGMIGFLHPKSTKGVLIEFAQKVGPH